MLKKFFLNFLGSMAAIWLTFILLTVLLICGIATSLLSLNDEIKSVANVEVTKGSVLVLDLSGDISERKTSPDLLAAVNGDIKIGVNLSETISAIYRAAHDSRICGIYVTCNGVSGGVASLQDIQEALNYFKTQGKKWVVAYADNYAQSDYYTVSGANEIWLNPIGAADIHGLSGTTLFFTGLLDKLGVKMQVLRVGTFKSAVEPYILKEMSPASRLQQESYMGALWGSMTDNIAANRSVTSTDINRWADDFTFTMSADSVKALGIVTNLGYRRQAEKRVAELANKDEFDDISRLSIPQYVTTFDAGDFSYLPGVAEPKSDTKTIAILYAEGEIFDSGNEGIAGDMLVKEINEITDDADNLAGLILRVNSPGGSAFASEQIWEALQHFKQTTGLPLYVSMGDLAASGGYYISCGADVIYAQPTTITGSIGIFGMIPEAQGLLQNHLGITTSTVQTNRNGNFPSILTPMTAEQTAKMQAYVERGYDLFTRRCAEGRKMSQDSIKAIAEGRVWAGSQAMNNGLVDRMGSLRTAISGMAADLNLASYKVKEYPESESEWWEMLLALDSDLESATTVMQKKDIDMSKAASWLRKLAEAPSVQCRMETVIIE